MRQRSISSVGVVIVGLVPAFMGGPVWAIVLAALFTIGAHEYQVLARHISPGTRPFALVLVPAFALAAATGGGAQALLGIVALAVGLPFFELILRQNLKGAFEEWALSAAGTLYLGVPLFAAVAMRKMGGTIDAGWLDDLAGWTSLGWDAAPRGLAWLLVVILITWLSDSGAYLVGRSFGRRPLIPVVSPKKTVEGLAGGLGAAALTGALAVSLFGLDVSWAIGLLLGLVVGSLGVVGDLAESIMKRQAGVKDSGTLIPGHGGMLDRLDALLFTLTAGWYLATLIDRIVT
ncbi:MAG: phosphatidate cytidylyltransferase [Thermomicrobiales bacterium]|nr:phosphatidate cytidylyltransferase [Thermomicrobiales bacterium]